MVGTSSTLPRESAAKGAAAQVERAKQEQMKKGEWKEELASQSETGVKADQEHVRDHDEHIDKLQKQTAQKKEEEHPQGKS